MEAGMSSNLLQHRTGANVWDAKARSECDLERWMAGLAAGALVVSGLRRRNPTGLLMVIAGGAMAWWATTETEVRRHRRTQMMAALPGSKPHGDPVSNSSEASFPASDPPSWTPTTVSP
jgi:hypothetical protein